MKTANLLFLFILLAIGLQAQNPNPLSESEFEKLREEVAGQSFDTKRVAKAKELSDAQWLYVNQIKAIMESFSLEGNKLEYAKYAYSTTLDAENYQDLMSLFRMGATKDDLKEYISKREVPVAPGKVEEKEAVIVDENVVETVESSSTTTVKVVTKTTGPVAMNDQDFAAAKRKVQEESYESARFRRAKQTVDANYMLSSQVKELLEVLEFESNRLDFSKYAYEKTFDQANYSIVKEGLKHSRSRDELTTFLKDKPVADYTVKEEVVEAKVDDSGETTGEEHSPKAISKDDFVNAKNQISSQSSDSKKLEKAKLIVDRSYLMVSQVKSIIDMFLFEDNRLDFAKYAYPKTADKKNYASVKEVLDKESHKLLDDYVKKIDSENVEEIPDSGPSELSKEDFEALAKRIKNSALESHKLEKAKTIVDRSHVSASQVKQINGLFTLEESRLEFSKYAYNKTLDKDNYSIVRESMDKSTSKYALDKFIKNQK